MKEFQLTVKDPNGLHARPAGLLVREAQRLPDRITILTKEKQADLKKLLAVMGLGIRHGDTVTIRIEGDDEEASLSHLQEAFRQANI